jgi:hypothetical protein
MLTRVFVGELMTQVINPAFFFCFSRNPIQTLILKGPPACDPLSEFRNAPGPAGPPLRPLNLVSHQVAPPGHGALPV